jgi:glycosyltransferase involved in cell wall biosynthesis
MLLSNPGTNDKRPLKEAHSLARMGKSVTILAWDRDRVAPRDTALADGVVIKRFRVFAGHGTPLLTVPKLLLFHLWAFVHLAGGRFEAVHCHDVDTLSVGVVAKVLRVGGAKLVYDMHDLPEAFLRFFPAWSLLQRVFLAAARRAADLVVVASDGYVPYLLSLGFRADRLVSVLNAPSLAEGRDRTKTRPGLRVLYYGGLEEERGVRHLAEAASGLEGVTLTVAGRGRLEGWVSDLAKEKGNVRFLGWLSVRDLDREIDGSDLIPSLYAPKTRNIRLSTPGKLLASMAISEPALVPSGTHQAELVRRYGCGLEVPWGDVQRIREALKALAGTDGPYGPEAKSAFAAFRSGLNWESMEGRLGAAYGRLVG